MALKEEESEEKRVSAIEVYRENVHYIDTRAACVTIEGKKKRRMNKGQQGKYNIKKQKEEIRGGKKSEETNKTVKPQRENKQKNRKNKQGTKTEIKAPQTDTEENR